MAANLPYTPSVPPAYSTSMVSAPGPDARAHYTVPTAHTYTQLPHRPEYHHSDTHHHEHRSSRSENASGAHSKHRTHSPAEHLFFRTPTPEPMSSVDSYTDSAGYESADSRAHANTTSKRSRSGMYGVRSKSSPRSAKPVKPAKAKAKSVKPANARSRPRARFADDDDDDVGTVPPRRPNNMHRIVSLLILLFGAAGGAIASASRAHGKGMGRYTTRKALMGALIGALITSAARTRYLFRRAKGRQRLHPYEMSDYDGRDKTARSFRKKEKDMETALDYENKRARSKKRASRSMSHETIGDGRDSVAQTLQERASDMRTELDYGLAGSVERAGERKAQRRRRRRYERHHDDG